MSLAKPITSHPTARVGYGSPCLHSISEYTVIDRQHGRTDGNIILQLVLNTQGARVVRLDTTRQAVHPLAHGVVHTYSRISHTQAQQYGT